jgi:hypothetical protein
VAPAQRIGMGPKTVWGKSNLRDHKEEDWVKIIMGQR